MADLGTTLLVSDGLLLLAVPRRWAVLPLLAGTLYLPLTAGFDIGPFNFYSVRFLFAVAFLRVLLRGESPPGGVNGLDRTMLLWVAVAVMSSLFQPDIGAALVNRLGLVFTGGGAYYLLRTFCGPGEQLEHLFGVIAILLVPLAAAMAYESMTGSNPFGVLGGPTVSEVRNGVVRAQGPFAHAILAGCVGAAALPLMAPLWQRRPVTALAGFIASLTIVVATASSTPILSAGFAMVALFLWRWRHRMRTIRWMLLLGYIGLEIVMNAPAYYVITRIDMTGSSTSWHRAALIEAALTHWSEWWLTGASYTRHWLPYGVVWSSDHIDITNYYLRMGVDGGLALMLLFIGVLTKGFSLVGQAWRQEEQHSARVSYAMWALGASLFSHATAFISVSYYDQSVVFLFLALAAIRCGAFHANEPALDAALSEGRIREVPPGHATTQGDRVSIR